MLLPRTNARPNLKPALGRFDNDTAENRIPQLMLMSPHYGHCLPPLLLDGHLGDQADGEQVAGTSLRSLHQQRLNSRGQPISPPALYCYYKLCSMFLTSYISSTSRT